MTQPLSIDKAAAVFGWPVSHIEAVARGRKMKGRPTLDVPSTFEVRLSQETRTIGDYTATFVRRELWGDGRLLWAIEHSIAT
jgi:hypothetical protein